MPLKQTFIANLKKYRKKSRLSQMKLAEKCNTATSYIGEIEIGRKFPSIVMIEKIAAALSIKPYRLFLDTTDDEEIVIESELTEELKKDITRRLHKAIGTVIERL